MRITKSIIAWCLYDWAATAFSTIILTFVFAAYFTQHVAINTIVGTSQWATAVAIAGFLIAILSPILGAISDHEGRRKPWILIFAVIAMLASAALWLVKPSSDNVLLALLGLIIGMVGIEISLVFYNAMLRDIAPANSIGRISGWGWAAGYFGGLSSLSVVLIFFINGSASKFLNHATFEQIRICGPWVAVWYLFFSIPFFVWTKDSPSKKLSYRQAIKIGFRNLIHTVKDLKGYREVFKFLIARMIYTDGLNALFAFGGIYAAGTFKMSLIEVVKFGIALNIGAGIGALLLAGLNDYWGSKKMIIIGLLVVLLNGSAILLTHNEAWFWVFGIGLSLCVGPVQAASRSLMIELAPSHLITEFFGLYAFSGKATAFVAPWLIGWLTLLANSQRVGMSMVMVFLLIGTILLYTVQSEVNAK